MSTNLDVQGINSSEYGQHVKRLIQLVNTLVTLGAQADFELPKIAVIGNQSAGKSSLVEAITGITVPRDSGTCTRCPMECRMSNSPDPWQCQIFLRRVVDDRGILLTNRQDEPFGGIITEKKHLENMIRRAQLAILNPSVPSQRFVAFNLGTQTRAGAPPPLGSSKQFPFSPDLICLQISGPGLTDLSFVDLPGIISNVARGEDPSIISVIRDMVRENIQGRQTLILTTITMNDDIDNQGAAQLARDVDSQGQRTIGVLTKPDRIQPGEHDRWLKILQNEFHPLKHGYYITKQRSPTELKEGISFEEARRREAEFFRNEAPWKDLTRLRSRMGVEELTKALSQLLGAVIQDSLPSLRERSAQLYREAKDALEKFPPPPPDNPVAELIRLVTSFSNDVSRLIQGVDLFEQLLRRCRPAYKHFRYAIQSTAPDYRPFKDKAEGSSRQSDENLFLQEDLWEKIVPGSPVANGPSNSSPREPDSDSDSSSESSLGRSSGNNRDVLHTSPPLYLLEIRNVIESSITRELPFTVPFRAKSALIKKFFVEWEDHVAQCFKSICQATLEELKSLARTHFGHTRGTGLYGQVIFLIEEQVEKSKSRVQEQLARTLSLEDFPFTVNRHDFGTYRQRYLLRYQTARWAPRPTSEYDRDVQTALSALARIGFRGLEYVNLVKLRPGEDWEDELVVMAEAVAYFHVTYKRVIDNIPRVIDQDFLWGIEKEISETLVQGLELAENGATEKAKMFLAESEAVTKEREELVEKVRRLGEVHKTLVNFGM